MFTGACLNPPIRGSIVVSFRLAIGQRSSQSPYKGFNSWLVVSPLCHACLNPPIRGSIVGIAFLVMALIMSQSPYKGFNRESYNAWELPIFVSIPL